ncbi:GNAT family N-acetyltransferase [Streptomyces sp. NPDC049879]|uniref:GNAT family N-acetyltransferase n=1 Tax=Streptomyces sp. NPDC049879 TaxID=3365598 RepID=UPI00378DA480
MEATALPAARRLWTALAAPAPPFPTAPGGRAVAVSPDSRLAPPGWAGIVVLADTALITVPDEDTATAVRRALPALPGAALTDPDAVRAALPVDDVLGPAALAYAPPTGFRPDPDAAAGTVPPDDPGLARLLAESGADDAGESGLDEVTSPVSVLRDGPRIVAAAGHSIWPAGTAHVSVLVAPDARRRGLARRVGSAAVSRALADGLLPQWRARPEASRRVARALGLHELGSQLSVRLAPAAPRLTDARRPRPSAPPTAPTGAPPPPGPAPTA